jgi:hypothetical protein
MGLGLTPVPSLGDAAASGIDVPLAVDEQLVERYAYARLTPADGSALGPARDGELLLTGQRLVHINSATHAIELADIVELTISGDSLLLSLRHGGGVVVELPSAEQLRVAIADLLRDSQGPSR